eukprot:2241525-Pyramimonas_sp.AAC.1
MALLRACSGVYCCVHCDDDADSGDLKSSRDDVRAGFRRRLDRSTRSAAPRHSDRQDVEFRPTQRRSNLEHPLWDRRHVDLT